MKKVYIKKRPFMEPSWLSFQFSSKDYKVTNNIDESDYIFYIDSYETIDTDKPKLLFLIECPEILNLIYSEDYSRIIQTTNANMIFTYCKDYVDNKKIFSIFPPFPEWVTPNLKQKTKLISIISSNKNITSGHKIRHRCIQELKKLKYEVSLYGSGYNYIESKNKGLDDYCFSITIENSKVNGYFTEKILDCFLTGTIPIYWGDPSIGEIFDINGIIILNSLDDILNINFEMYEKMLPYVIKNYEIAKKYQNEKFNFEKYFLTGISKFDESQCNKK